MRISTVTRLLGATIVGIVTIGSAYISLQATTQPAAAGQKTAAQFYMDYRAAFAKATKMDDILPLMSAKKREEAKSIPAAEREEMFKLGKSMSAELKNVKVIKEEPTSDGATLTVEALDGKTKMKGTVQIAKEDGGWKLVEESWSSGS
jgi:hypothetical protein